jgi:hypothetical protein
VEGYDGRSGTIWTLQTAVSPGSGCSSANDARQAHQITSDIQGRVVADDRTDLREPRRARAAVGT